MMQVENAYEIFGEAASCTSTSEIASFIKAHTAAPELRRAAAAYGMVLVASGLARTKTYFEEALDLLTQLGKAKVEIDAAAWHSLDVVETTAALLLSAQQYVDEVTIPCTEWPSTEDVARVIYQGACRQVSS
jgi:hypothetical protein